MNYTTKKYNQLTENERFFIETMINLESPLIEIAKKLKRNISTISREIKRNTSKYGYFCKQAQKKYKKRQMNKYLFKWLDYSEFSLLFKKYYDPKTHGVELTREIIIQQNKDILIPSVKQIYNWINSNNWIVKKADRLRKFYKKGGKRIVGVFSRINAKFRLPIWTRPNKINNRSEFGHWEVDLIIGKRKSGCANLLVMTERKTRFNVIAKSYSKNPYKIIALIKYLINKYNLKVLSMTTDNGWEFKAMGLIGHWLKIKTYYCEPYASHQRGSNENANGLVRRFYKKGTNFNQVSNREIESVMDQINNMKRKMFGWISSIEMYIKAK